MTFACPQLSCPINQGGTIAFTVTGGASPGLKTATIATPSALSSYYLDGSGTARDLAVVTVAALNAADGTATWSISYPVDTKITLSRSGASGESITSATLTFGGDLPMGTYGFHTAVGSQSLAEFSLTGTYRRRGCWVPNGSDVIETAHNARREHTVRGNRTPAGHSYFTEYFAGRATPRSVFVPGVPAVLVEERHTSSIPYVLRVTSLSTGDTNATLEDLLAFHLEQSSGTTLKPMRYAEDKASPAVYHEVHLLPEQLRGIDAMIALAEESPHSWDVELKFVDAP